MGKYLFLIVVVAFLILGVSILILKGNENEQQEAINCSSELYNFGKVVYENFSSQCLGTCKNYAVDIVHTPRTEYDNLPENQCEDFRNGKVKHFIELDKDGNIVRIV
jgi:hypothetical protein